LVRTKKREGLIRYAIANSIFKLKKLLSEKIYLDNGVFSFRPYKLN
jgi:hypothetical protein